MTTAAETLEIPNAPSWSFDPAIADDERTRLQDDVVAALKTVYDPRFPATSTSSASSTRWMCPRAGSSPCR